AEADGDGRARRHGTVPGFVGDHHLRPRLGVPAVPRLGDLLTSGERPPQLPAVAGARRRPHPEQPAPIVGATRPEHVDDAVAAVELTLRPEECAALEAPYRPRPVRGHT